MGVGVKVDGLMVLTGLTVAGLGYLVWKLPKPKKEWVDPTSHENLAYQGAAKLGDAVGVPDADARGVPLDDYVFAVLDKINPFNESDSYAEYVLSGRENFL